MKITAKILSVLLVAIILATAIIPSAFARDFAPVIDVTNLGVQTQYLYSENDVSWLRKLVVKEDMLSSEGILTESELIPITDYPYTTDASHFEAEVEECIKTYTLDEESQRAAYLYLLENIGALTIISEPTTSDATKADWLRQNGVLITKEEENDPDKILLISALYAMMRNDLYYVYTGEHFEMPTNTPLEEAVVIYIAAMSGNENSLLAFVYKYFGSASLGSLEDYIYYTALFALWEEGLVSVNEIPKLSRKEVFRRLAIKSIMTYGLAIDAENATTEEIQIKYLTAMLGTHYDVKLDPQSLTASADAQGVPFYILQRMANQDAGLTLSSTKYTYEKCFEEVLKKTNRFDLDKEFYSDVYEYDVFLKNTRSSIYINPSPITSTAIITINGVQVPAGQYAEVQLQNASIQAITIVCTHKVNNQTKSSTYKLNVIQGTTAAPPSDLTGLIPTYGTSGSDSVSVNVTVTDQYGNLVVTLPDISGQFPYVTIPNGIASGLIGDILYRNEKGQLVDGDGNVIVDGDFDPLPDGYQYIVGEGGVIMVVLNTEPTTEPIGKKLTDEQIRKYVIIGASVLCGLLVIALFVVLIIVKKRSNMTPAQRVRARKNKEKAKKAKLEARQSKRKK